MRSCIWGLHLVRVHCATVAISGLLHFAFILDCCSRDQTADAISSWRSANVKVPSGRYQLRVNLTVTLSRDDLDEALTHAVKAYQQIGQGNDQNPLYKIETPQAFEARLRREVQQNSEQGVIEHKYWLDVRYVDETRFLVQLKRTTIQGTGQTEVGPIWLERNGPIVGVSSETDSSEVWVYDVSTVSSQGMAAAVGNWSLFEDCLRELRSLMTDFPPGFSTIHWEAAKVVGRETEANHRAMWLEGFSTSGESVTRIKVVVDPLHGYCPLAIEKELPDGTHIEINAGEVVELSPSLWKPLKLDISYLAGAEKKLTLRKQIEFKEIDLHTPIREEDAEMPLATVRKIYDFRESGKTGHSYRFKEDMETAIRSSFFRKITEEEKADREKRSAQIAARTAEALRMASVHRAEAKRLAGKSHLKLVAPLLIVSLVVIVVAGYFAVKRRSLNRGAP